MQILENRKDTIVVLQEGKVDVVSKDDYMSLKINFFDCKRILYKMSEDAEINETFDNGIFNVRLGESTMQMRDTPKIVKIIFDHIQTKEISPFIEYFKEQYIASNRVSVILDFLAEYSDRLSSQGNLIVVDNMFAVDDRGAAYVFNGTAKNYLCIVVSSSSIESFGDIEVETPAGSVVLGITEVTMLAKIMFLLYPNIDDGVFMNQLPSDIKLRLTSKTTNIKVSKPKKIAVMFGRKKKITWNKAKELLEQERQYLIEQYGVESVA